MPSTSLSVLNKLVPIYTLVWLRIALGLLGGGDILGNGIYHHWYKGDFDGFTFTYYGFEWVKPLPEPFFSLYFVVGFLLGLAVAAGWRFRITAPLFALFFSYLYLLEKAHYLNHAYLFCWLVWLLPLTPAWREWSLDVRRRPSEWSPVAPAWTVFLFPALMGLVYFFGGIAKWNADWLLHAMPLKLWLARHAEMPILGPIWTKGITAYVMAWSGMLLDLSAPFLLLHKRLRWLALGFLVFFHATNHLIFNIGIFPYLSLVLTSMFFAPDWPKRFIGWWVGEGSSGGRWGWARAQVQRWREKWQARVAPHRDRPAAVRLIRVKLLLTAGALLLAIHCYLPFRHWLFPGDVAWTEEGHRYGWRMMLRSKQGLGTYLVVDRATGQEEIIRPKDSLTRRQYQKLTTHPDMILQYAHHLRDERKALGKEVSIYGRFRVRLNGRPRHQFIDPEVNLATTEWQWWGRKDWVLDEGEKNRENARLPPSERRLPADN
jgi:vitamin K-dependent gamma-carboxylase